MKSTKYCRKKIQSNIKPKIRGGLSLIALSASVSLSVEVSQSAVFLKAAGGGCFELYKNTC